MARIISVALPKGGVGKTTTAVNLAASLAAAEQRTLLVDMDTFGASALSLGFTEGTVKAGLYEVFNFVTSMQNAILRTELSFLDFVPSNVQSMQREERMARIADNRSILRGVLRTVAHQYAYIILDCPPVLRGLCTNALAASHSVLMPVRPGHFALEAVDRIFAYLDWIREVANKDIAVEGILLTMHEPGTRVSDITLRELQGKYKKFMLKTTIPRNTVLSEASFYGRPALLYNVNSRGSSAYLALAEEVMAHAAGQNAAPLQSTILQKFGRTA